LGAAAALAVAWFSELRTPDRRVLYSAWSASAIAAAFIALLLGLRSDVRILFVATVMSTIFHATAARLRAGR